MLDNGLFSAIRKYFFFNQIMIDIVFLGFTVVIGLRFLFRADRVTHGTIWASLCVYLLLGIVWADVYSMLDYLNLDAFEPSLAAEASPGQMHLGAQGSVVPLYYSFVTMTTLGYGDIAPQSKIAQDLAILQALIGQIYLVVIIGRLVAVAVSTNDRE